MEIVNCLDIGMVQPAQDQGFAAETSARRLVGQRLGIEHLDCNVALEPLVASTVHNAHAASSDLFDETEMAKDLPGGEARRHHIDSYKRIV